MMMMTKMKKCTKQTCSKPVLKIQSKACGLWGIEKRKGENVPSDDVVDVLEVLCLSRRDAVMLR
jgi:hypothetical protein